MSIRVCLRTVASAPRDGAVQGPLQRRFGSMPWQGTGRRLRPQKCPPCRSHICKPVVANQRLGPQGMMDGHAPPPWKRLFLRHTRGRCRISRSGRLRNGAPPVSKQAICFPFSISISTATSDEVNRRRPVSCVCAAPIHPIPSVSSAPIKTLGSAVSGHEPGGSYLRNSGRRPDEAAQNVMNLVDGGPVWLWSV